MVQRLHYAYQIRSNFNLNVKKRKPCSSNGDFRQHRLFVPDWMLGQKVFFVHKVKNAKWIVNFISMRKIQLNLQSFRMQTLEPIAADR